jgi:hypothetical protein
MATQSYLYSSLTAFTITLVSLASYGAREGTLVANSTNLYIDLIMSGKLTVGAAAATGDCYLLLSSSDGTNISYPATGADANLTLPPVGMLSLGSLNPGDKVPGTALRFCLKIPTNGVAATTAVPFDSFSVAQIFNGQIPLGGVAPVIVNAQGQAFDATSGHFAIDYVGVKYTIA